jgi:hypothetical protein
MDANPNAQPTEIADDSPIAERDAQPAPRQAWHAPVITRIEIRRTANGNSGNVDGPTCEWTV